MPDASIITSTLMMLVVVGILAGILFVIKRMNLGAKKGINSIPLQVISKLTIQPRVNIFIVKAGNRTLMIGVGDKTISTLADLTAGNESNNNNIPKNDSGNLINNLPAKNNIIEPAANESLSFGSFLKTVFKK